jgi:anti-sigma regulatory factor (Ser/Thr protein kinase)
VPDVAAAQGLRHTVLFYRNLPEYRAAVRHYAQAGLDNGEPVLLALPRPAVVLPAYQPALRDQVAVTDLSDLGRNPARIIPALLAFAHARGHGGGRVRILCESIWPGRTPAEVREASWHDGLMDRALADVPATLVCPYSAGLPSDVLSTAAGTHPWQFGSDAFAPSPAYTEAAWPASRQQALPSPPPDAAMIEYRSDLRPLRAMITDVGQRARLPTGKVTDLTIAVNEIAANTLRHTSAGGVARAWQSGGEVVCQLSDTGFIDDPMAGLRRNAIDEPGGQGLWLVNQLCDLVEIRTGAAGTVVRLHMRVPGRLWPARRA